VVTIEDALTFDEQEPGTTSSAKTVNVSNQGGASQALGAPSISGDNPDAFEVRDNCGGTLNATSGCTVDVYFKPSKEGEYSASLDIVDGVGGVLASVQLSGTGRLGKPDISVEPSSLSFDENERTGSASISNNGQGEASISASIGGSNSSAFSISGNDCGSALEGGSSCSITVQFSPPSDPGGYGATLYVADASGNNFGSVDLSGTVSAGAEPTPTEAMAPEPPPTEESPPTEEPQPDDG